MHIFQKFNISNIQITSLWSSRHSDILKSGRNPRLTSDATNRHRSHVLIYDARRAWRGWMRNRRTRPAQVLSCQYHPFNHLGITLTAISSDIRSVSPVRSSSVSSIQVLELKARHLTNIAAWLLGCVRSISVQIAVHWSCSLLRKCINAIQSYVRRLRPLKGDCSYKIWASHYGGF